MVTAPSIKFRNLAISCVRIIATLAGSKALAWVARSHRSEGSIFSPTQYSLMEPAITNSPHATAGWVKAHTPPKSFPSYSTSMGGVN